MECAVRSLSQNSRWAQFRYANATQCGVVMRTENNCRPAATDRLASSPRSPNGAASMLHLRCSLTLAATCDYAPRRAFRSRLQVQRAFPDFGTPQANTRHRPAQTAAARAPSVAAARVDLVGSVRDAGRQAGALAGSSLRRASRVAAAPRAVDRCLCPGRGGGEVTTGPGAPSRCRQRVLVNG